MSNPYIGEIRLFGGNFAPSGWAFCDGSLLAIAENTALFALIGTTYGGDGASTFGLPDLRGRAVVGTGQGPGLSDYVIGQSGGAETVTLDVATMPAHGLATSTATQTTHRPGPAAALAAGTGGSYAPAAAADTSLAPVGGGQPHENMPPFLVVTYIISLFGIFPSQS
jgi:microcystin-dependent protein